MASRPQCACITTEMANSVSNGCDGNASAAGNSNSNPKLKPRSAVHSPEWSPPAADWFGALSEMLRIVKLFCKWIENYDQFQLRDFDKCGRHTIATGAMRHSLAANNGMASFLSNSLTQVLFAGTDAWVLKRLTLDNRADTEMQTKPKCNFR